MTVKNWNFGAYKPIDNYDLFDQQIYAGHSYRNQLVEIELKRRDSFHQTLRQLSKEYADAANQRQLKADTLGLLYDDILGAKSKARKNVKPTEEQQAQIDDAKKQLAEAYDALEKAQTLAIKKVKGEIEKIKTALAPKYPEPNYTGMSESDAENARVQWAKKFKTAWLAEAAKRGFDAGEHESRERRKIARKNTTAYWGTYGMVEESAKNIGKGLPPKFKRYDKTGYVSVQLQKTAKGPNLRKWSDLVSGKNTFARVIMPTPVDKTKPIGTRHGNKTNLAYLQIRIGSVGREPVFTTVPFILSRVPDNDAEVMRVTVHRNKIGPDFEYIVRFTLEVDDSDVVKGDGPVSVHLGARSFEDCLRIGLIYDGETLTDIKLPAKEVGTLNHLDSLQSVRDLEFNNVIQWMKSVVLQGVLPDWINTELEHMHLWQAPSRMCEFFLKWVSTNDNASKQIKATNHTFVEWVAGLQARPIVQRQRVPYDPTTIYGVLDGWYRWDLHMHRWHANLTRKVAARRNMLYRNVIADLRRRYGTLIIANVNYKAIAEKNTDPTKVDALSNFHRRNLRFASLGTFTNWAKEKFQDDVIIVDAKHITVTCNSCGHINKRDGSCLHIGCEKCNTLIDQDENAVKNQFVKGTSEQNVLA